MEWDNKLPEWKNEGAEPSATRKEKGFEAGYKPPAGIFNWFWSKVSKAITEIQTKFGDHAENKENPHGVTAKQLNLDKVNNTADSEKSVKFASEAGEGRKVKNKLVVRFNGGSTEGTDLWTFDGSTGKSINITPDKIGAPQKAHSHETTDINGLRSEIDRIVAATSTDGVNYTATIEGITELYNGLTITIIPNMLSTSKNTTLNVNGLGAKQLRCSIGGYNFGNSGTIAALEGWLGADSPVTIQYKSKFDNWQTIIPRPSVSGLYGTVGVDQGGTGATDAAKARENLGITPANIGAVPKGYGYGEQMEEVTSSAEETYEQYCAKIDAILAGMANRETKQINAAPPYSEDATFGACAVMLYKGTDAYASLVTVGHSNKYAYGWRMQKREGVWQPFEWIDPPMNTNVVYRTIERYKGNAVYKKLGSDGVIYWSTDNSTWNTYATQTAGTFAGQVVANSAGQTPATSLLRNSKLVSSETNPAVNGEICWTYE